LTTSAVKVVFQPCPLSIVGDAASCPRDLAGGGLVAVEVGNEVVVLTRCGPSGVVNSKPPVSRAGRRREGNRVGYTIDQSCRRHDGAGLKLLEVHGVSTALVGCSLVDANRYGRIGGNGKCRGV